MNKNKNHNDHYTAADIKRYLEGSMSAEEMHYIEKAALEDPFLADAIEGMSQEIAVHGKRSFESDVDLLRKKVRREKGWHPGLILKAAAILFVIATGIVITYIINDGANEKQVVLSRVEEKKKDSAAEVVENKSTVSAGVPDTPIMGLDEVQKETGIEATKEEEELLNRKNAPSLRNNDTNDAVLPSVQEEVLADSQATAAPQPDVNKQLQGRAAGVTLEGSRRKAKPADSSEKMEEVVVSGYGSVKRKNRREDNSIIKAGNRFEPEGGWRAFEQYVINNVKLPDSAAGSHGMERVSFRIGDEGKATDIRIEASVSPAHDAEIIRLLSGTRWKKLKGGRRRVELGISF